MEWLCTGPRFDEGATQKWAVGETRGVYQLEFRGFIIAVVYIISD